MATTCRRKEPSINYSVIDRLIDKPYEFQFHQAIRLLEQASQEKSAIGQLHAAIGHSTSPNNEFVRFKHSSSLRFNAASIQNIESVSLSHNDESTQYQWLVNSSCLGLTGSEGILPFHTSELIQQQAREKSTSLADFFDLFNHRTLSLFYRAWHKYRLPVNYEENRLTSKHNNPAPPPTKRDHFTIALASLCGLGTLLYEKELPIPLESLISYSGLLSQGNISASALESIIASYFDLVVEIEQFQPQWQSIPTDIQTQLPSQENPLGTNNILGANMILGCEGYHIQSKFMIRISPLAYDEFMSLSPGSKKLVALQKLIQLAVGEEFDFELSITVNDGEIPAAALVSNNVYQPKLGWNTHLSSSSNGNDLVEVVLSKGTTALGDDLPLAS